MGKKNKLSYARATHVCCSTFHSGAHVNMLEQPVKIIDSHHIDIKPATLHLSLQFECLYL